MIFYRRILICLLALLTSSHPLLSQDISKYEKDIIRNVNEADGYFIYDEDYEAASKIYLELFELKPLNHNLNYKLGICFLNMTGMRKQALVLLEYALTNYVEDEFYSTIGEPAPFDVLYYYAYACQINNNLERAIEYYKKYSNLLRAAEASEIKFINMQVMACRNALESIKKNQYLGKNILTPWLLSFRDVSNPIISDNDSIFAFTVKKESGNKIYFSVKEGESWLKPEDITGDLGNFKDMFTNSITGDGKTMVLSRNDGFRGDIYISFLKNGSWSKLKKLGKTVNTKYWESHASISKDGSMLFFASNNPGGYGSLDIYSAVIASDGTCGPAKNLGPSINTSLEENTPYYDMESNTIWFSSTGHEGYGGYDIFYSVFERRWSHPNHMPHPVNTTSDDLNYIPYKGKYTGLLSTTLTDTSTTYNIFRISIEEELPDKSIIARGTISLEDGLELVPSNLELTLQNSLHDSLVRKIDADIMGNFSIELDPGVYKLEITYTDYVSENLDLILPEDFGMDEIIINKSLIPEMIASGEYLAIKNILFEFDKSDLNRDAMIEIEKVVPVLINSPDLQIELRGFADAIGGKDYNTNLSGQRAAAVEQYLLASGIDKSRIRLFAAGASDFLSDNFHKDGSDNPEGRKYNRRVSISIIDNGYSVPVESFRHIPRHLKKKYSYAYYVVIEKSEKSLSPNYFKRFKREEFAFIKEIEAGSEFYYLIGEFAGRTDALCYLISARETGFTDAYIITEYDLPLPENIDTDIPIIPSLYTIQIHALKNPALQNFKGLKGVKEIKGRDGFYRYTVGEYLSYSKATQALQKIRKLGYSQAFIKKLDLLEHQSIINNEKQ